MKMTAGSLLPQKKEKRNDEESHKSILSAPLSKLQPSNHLLLPLNLLQQLILIFFRFFNSYRIFLQISLYLHSQFAYY